MTAEMDQPPVAADLLEQARDAMGRGEWQQAHLLFSQADAIEPLDNADVGRLAEVAYAAGRLDVTIDTWERAYARNLRSGDRLAAAGAAVRVAMHLLFDTALMAPVRGWLNRAAGLVEADGETPVHAWLAVVRNYERLLSGDFATAGDWARRAIEIGSKCEPAAAAVARIAEARGLILGGDVSRGLGLLNESAVAAVSGELNPLFTGLVYCEVVCAFQALAQYDQAEEWTSAMERWSRKQPIGSLHGRCRVHRAEIMRLRGWSAQAEQEALLACDELRPYLRRELGWPLTELGRIRLRRGDIQGAEEAFRAAHEMGWDPQPGPALLHLAKGEVEAAARSIRDALEHPGKVPSKELPPNTELRRAPLLEAQVEIAVKAGEIELARTAAGELAGIATRFESKALQASAALAGGTVALGAGDPAGARAAFEEAVHLWNEIGAPHETAIARMGLAQSHRAASNDERAILEFRAAQSGFERAGAVALAAAAAQACSGGPGDSTATKLPPQQPASVSADREQNVFRRDGEYWALAFEGKTVLLRDQKGLHYLSRLLAHPFRDFHVLDLVAGGAGTAAGAGDELEPGLTVSLGMDAGVLLDAKAKAAYRRRLLEIEEDCDDALASGDYERAVQAEGERDFLIRELARAVGLGGRDRRAASTSERARASVTRAVRHAMARVDEHHAELGAHLSRTVRTGVTCAYVPDPRVPIAWRV